MTLPTTAPPADAEEPGRSGLPATTVERLRAVTGGRVLTPADPAWDSARRPWNVAVQQRPAAVIDIDQATDLPGLVALAGAEGLRLTAQPNGHGASTDMAGLVLVRTRGLDGVWVDAEARVARVGAGVKWGELLAALRGCGLVGMVGSNPDVTVAGYMLGGGLSWFGRRHGFAAQALRAVEIVDAQARRRWVTDASDPELMWALRGGGGDFGIVTALELDLQPAPRLYGGKLSFPAEQAPAVLEAFDAVSAAAPPELTAWATVMHFPPLPDLPEQLRGGSFVMVDLIHLGGAADAERLIGAIRDAGTVLADTVGPLEVDQIGGVAQEPTEPTPALDWSTLLGSLTSATLDRLLEAVGDRRATPLTAVQLRRLGGALREEGARPAVAGRVEEPYLLYSLGIAPVPQATAAVRAGFTRLRAAVAEEMTDRTTFTFLAATDPLSRVYDTGRLARLQETKRSYDPAGVFASNHPVLAG